MKTTTRRRVARFFGVYTLILLPMAVKNIEGTMAFSIFFSLILGSLGSVVGDSYLGKLLLLMNFSPTAVPNPQAVDIWIALAVALSYLTLCSGIGGLTFNKVDIK